MQPTLFELYRSVVLPISGQTETAREASASGAKQAVKTYTVKQDRILAALEKHGELSRYQLSERTGIPINAICSVIDYLMKQGDVERTGKAITKHWPDGGETLQETFRRTRR